jgi:DNA-binding LacI/PurR family transcriptional regulator
VARTRATVSIKDVAVAAGVSTATVSRVLSRTSAETPIRPATRERVEHAIEELGYRPNDLARALLQHRSSAIGLVLPDISNPYYPPLVRAVEDVASRHGYRVVLCNTDREQEKAAAYLEVLVKTRVDGIVIAGGGTVLPPESLVLRTYQTKIVTVGRHETDHPSVRIDNHAAQRSATEHLTALGHRRIGYIGGPADSRTAQDRLAGHGDALRDAGIEADGELVVHGGFDEAGGHRAAQALLRLDERPTALLCANDRAAFGAYAALVDAGLSVPRDMSVIGFDDVPMASYVRPTLTTVSVPTYDLGSHATDILLAAIDGHERPRPVVLPTTLRVRDSVAAPRA